MKKTILLAAIIVMLTSCADEFLKEKPYSTIAPETFYNNDQDAEAATLAIYNAIYMNAGLFRSIIAVFPESSSDLFIANPAASVAGREMADFLYNSESTNVKSAWTDTYDCIKRANSVIDNLMRNVPVSADAKSKLTGEAKFGRALMYYYLVQLFGDVPLVTSEVKSLDNIDLPRKPASEVWSQIVADLTDAISTLPEKSQYQGVHKARASKGAARILLAKVYMTLGKWPLALKQIDDIISSKEYALQPDIRTVFQVAYENGLESIFEAQYITGLSIKAGSSCFAYFVPGTPFSGFQTLFVNEKMIAKYDKNSVRYKAFFTDKGSYTGLDGKVIKTGYPQYFLYKLYDVYRPAGILKSTFNDYEFNFRIFRYADVLLMKAECENEINGPNDAGLNALNAIRSRAGEAIIPLSSVGSKNQFRETIFLERAMELIGEGHRWYDLKRLGESTMIQKIKEAKGIDVQAYQLLWPIPNSELKISKVLLQNPGWQ
ncbi:MAG: RagB/SusD family nutrient uptake outer membrane protein [Bacteroidota bacterium]|nr:RagB/SusD family nutrient uptake outer membrane protein [Bacteroidota bacterium]